MIDPRRLLACAALFVASIAYGQPASRSIPADFWTPAEAQEYHACLPKAFASFKDQRSAESYCLIDEEHKRWLRNHRRSAKGKHDSAAMQDCLHRNTAKINGTPTEFRAAYDGCMCEAYGLPGGN